MTILTVGNLGVPKTEIPKIPEIPKTSKDNCVCLLLPTNFLVYFVWSVLDTVIVLGPSLSVVATYMPKLTRSLHRCMHTSLHQYFIEDLKIPSAALLLQ